VRVRVCVCVCVCGQVESLKLKVDPLGAIIDKPSKVTRRYTAACITHEIGNADLQTDKVTCN